MSRFYIMETQEYMDNKCLIVDARDFDFELKTIHDKIVETKSTKVLFMSLGEYELPGGNRVEILNKLNRLIEKTGVKFHIIFGAKDDEFYEIFNSYENINLIFWPTFLLHFSYYQLFPFYSDYIEQIKIEKEFTKLFVSFNLKPHNHRCELIDKLYLNGLFRHGNISWNMMSEGYQTDQYIFKYWNEELLSVDGFSGDERTPNLLKTGAPIFLVTESNIKCQFITEKTFKPIIFEQPFLSIGSKNQNLILKQYGFELYDELFDFTFDTKQNISDRIDGVINNLEKLINHDYYTLYDNVYGKVIRNKKRALEIIDNDPYMPNEFIDIYLNNTDEINKKSYGFINKTMKNKK